MSTASLVFSGGGPVSEATRGKVLTAAAELDYAGPDPRARSLRRGRSGVIAVVIEERVIDAFRDPVAIAFLDGIGQEISDSGAALLLVPDAGGGHTSLESAAMDAVVLVGCSPHVDRAVQTARRRGVPVVSLGGTPFADVPAVELDDREATATLAGHLRDLGHRRVATVTLPLGPERRRDRLTAEAVAAATVRTAVERLAGARSVFPDMDGVVAASSRVEEGRVAGRELLAAPDRPTAVLAQSDLLAAGVILAAEELGLSVPGDLSVVGFDGIRIDTVVPHDLTTMVQPAADQGRAAAALAIARIDGQDVASEHFRSEFHRGGTTAPPRG
ncbi:transcriptional regulator [Nakamurella endophytica]|uniref:Transcriptional regulator n=1 Tax=Nakamurella endophytica TaxID=1748367 RepID=A0A917WAK6_9ACTN|nr:transcriptional regulator [Nakamurella endophytica]